MFRQPSPNTNHWLMMNGHETTSGIAHSPFVWTPKTGWRGAGISDSWEYVATQRCSGCDSLDWSAHVFVGTDCGRRVVRRSRCNPRVLGCQGSQHRLEDCTTSVTQTGVNEGFVAKLASGSQVRHLRFCWIHMNLHRGALGVLISNGVSVLLRKRIRCVSAAVILAADLVRVDNFGAVRRRGATMSCLDGYFLYRRWHHCPSGTVGKPRKSPRFRPCGGHQQRNTEQGQKR